MEFVIKLDIQDWRNFNSYLCHKHQKLTKKWYDNFFMSLSIWVIIGVLSVAILRLFGYGSIHWPTFFVLVFWGFIIYAGDKYREYRLGKTFEPLSNGAFCGEHKFVFNDDGIVTEGMGYEGKLSWDTVHTIERFNGMIMMFIDTGNAYVFPEAKLDKPDAFYEYLVRQKH